MAVSLPITFTQNLPSIVKREIAEPTVKNIGSDGRQKIVIRIISLLDVKFENEQAQNLAISEFKSFIRDYNITSFEIVEAYKMTIKGLLFDENDKKIEIYPNLSLITCAKILDAYINFKRNDKQYEIGKDMIAKFLNPPPPEPTEEEKKQKREELKKNIEECIKLTGSCEYAFIIYDDLKDSGVLEPYRNKEEIKAIQDRFMTTFLNSEMTRNLFYNPYELKELTRKFRNNEKYKIPGIIVQQVKNKIIENYYKEKNGSTN